MKKIIVILGLVLLFLDCDNNRSTIRQIDISGVLEKRQIVLISKMEDGTGVVLRRTAYIRDLSDSIYYISCIPLEIWSDYFKDAQKGDTIKFY